MIRYRRSQAQTYSSRKLALRIEQLASATGLPLPAYQTDGAAGLDLVAAVPRNKPMRLTPGARVLVPTGLRLALPHGTEAQVRPRSGLALKHGVTVLNSPGTIDSDYRGEVQVILVNLGRETFVVKRGERIAQLIVSPVSRARLTAATLDETARGAGGFGSTGLGTGTRLPSAETPAADESINSPVRSQKGSTGMARAATAKRNGARKAARKPAARKAAAKPAAKKTARRPAKKSARAAAKRPARKVARAPAAKKAAPRKSARKTVARRAAAGVGRGIARKATVKTARKAASKTTAKTARRTTARRTSVKTAARKKSTSLRGRRR